MHTKWFFSFRALLSRKKSQRMRKKKPAIITMFTWSLIELFIFHIILDIKRNTQKQACHAREVHLLTNWFMISLCIGEIFFLHYQTTSQANHIPSHLIKLEQGVIVIMRRSFHTQSKSKTYISFPNKYRHVLHYLFVLMLIRVILREVDSAGW